MKLKNANRPPAVYYGLHFTPGVAEYKDQPGSPVYLIQEPTAKAMDPSFSGKPVYVHHVDEVNLETIQDDADGYVFESFYNKSDGNHWCKFIVVSDAAHEAIAKGWQLSNAYVMQKKTSGGQWQGVNYTAEITQGEYEHLGIVPNPRYSQSIILTPEDFKKYNNDKEAALLKLANSKGEPMLKLFKKTKVENATDIEGMSVTLPKSKKEVELMKLINDMDEMEMNSDKPVNANGDHRVKVGEEEMSVNELVEKYNAMCAEKNAVEPDDEDAKKKALELAAHEEEEIEAKKAENDEADKKKIEEAEKAKNAKENFEKLKNAEKKAVAERLANAKKIVETSADQVLRGKNRYGSN